MKVTFPIVVVLLAISSAALGSIYAWNSRKRPPVSLTEAVALAEKAMGEDAAGRYCVSASIVGSKEGDGKAGAWWLVFAAEDGSSHHVNVNMSKHVIVRVSNGADGQPRLGPFAAGLEDVKRQVEAVFDKHKIDAKVELMGDAVVASYRTRSYTVYPMNDDGEFSEKGVEVTGPSRSGLWAEFRISDKPSFRVDDNWNKGPYWGQAYDSYAFPAGGKYVVVDVRYGTKFSHRVVTDLTQSFGPRFRP